MPTSREGTRDFKMSLAIFSLVIPLPGLSLCSNYSPGAHSSDAPKESAVFCTRTFNKSQPQLAFIFFMVILMSTFLIVTGILILVISQSISLKTFCTKKFFSTYTELKFILDTLGIFGIFLLVFGLATKYI